MLVYPMRIYQRELCKRIKKIIPKFTILKILHKRIQIRGYIVSNDKIEATGFKPEWSIEAGIKELIRDLK